MSSRGRAVLASLLLAALFALPLLSEILGARRLVFRDAQITHWPWRRVAMTALESGHAPFVNEGASGGQPLLSNPNAVLLYPTVLLEKVVSPASAFNLHYLLQVLWAFFGARLLARRLGQSEGAAFVSGAAFAFSGMMLSYASAFANSSAAAAWLPWCGAAALSLARASAAREALRRIPALAIALGLQLLAGEPAISLLTIVFAGAIGLAASGSRSSPRGRGALRFAWSAAAAGAAGAALAAPLLLPLSKVLPMTYRGQHLYSERAFGASPFELWRVVEWLFPRFSGEAGALGAGAHWQYALHPSNLVYIWCVTFGVIPFLLVLLAGLSRDFWRGAPGGFAAGALVSLLFAFGYALPFYRILAQVDLLRRLRYPIKFYLLTTICVALLAGFAVDRLASQRFRRRQIAALGTVALLFVLALAAAREGALLERLARPLLAELKAPAEALLPAIRAAFRADALVGFGAAAAVGLVLFWKPRAPATGYLLGLAILLFSLPFGLPLFVSAPEKDLRRAPDVLAWLGGAGRVYVSPSLPEFNVLATGTAHPEMPPRVSKLARVQIEELIPGTGLPFGVRYLFDADPDGSYGYYNRLVSEAVNASDLAERSRLLRAFGARWILAGESERFPETRAVTGLTVAGRRLMLFELDRPAAELRWAGRERRRASLSGALGLLRSADFDPRDEVVLPGASDADSPATSRGRVLPVRVSADGAEVRVESDGPGHVVFSRTNFPSWKARVNGRAAPVLVANARDLAVAVPAGSHHVELEWDRRPFFGGVKVQAATLALLAAAAIASRRRRFGGAV